ncbi:hypothetical protein MPSEU_000031000 [Mayamaea pseudoterrestris]|nr:hypothetical protein MPSEU_000031000 [Mayamaea pseudoterrestris]
MSDLPNIFSLETPRVSRFFRGVDENGKPYEGWFDGTVVKYEHELYRVEYDDGDAEDMDLLEVLEAAAYYYVPSSRPQMISSRRRGRPKKVNMVSEDDNVKTVAKRKRKLEAGASKTSKSKNTADQEDVTLDDDDDSDMEDADTDAKQGRASRSKAAKTQTIRRNVRKGKIKVDDDTSGMDTDGIEDEDNDEEASQGSLDSNIVKEILEDSDELNLEEEHESEDEDWHKATAPRKTPTKRQKPKDAASPSKGKASSDRKANAKELDDYTDSDDDEWFEKNLPSLKSPLGKRQKSTAASSNKKSASKDSADASADDEDWLEAHGPGKHTPTKRQMAMEAAASPLKKLDVEEAAADSADEAKESSKDTSTKRTESDTKVGATEPAAAAVASTDTTSVKDDNTKEPPAAAAVAITVGMEVVESQMASFVGEEAPLKNDPVLDEGWIRLRTEVKSHDLPKKLPDILLLMDEFFPGNSYHEKLWTAPTGTYQGTNVSGKRTRDRLRKLQDDGHAGVAWHGKSQEWVPQTKRDLEAFFQVLMDLAASC